LSLANKEFPWIT